MVFVHGWLILLTLVVCDKLIPVVCPAGPVPLLRKLPGLAGVWFNCVNVRTVSATLIPLCFTSFVRWVSFNACCAALFLCISAAIPIAAVR
uniref:Secreted protein n=1 Tax=Panstrongylus lignarius TaxID=156445 RepID=A0A224XYR4_9HEMI